MPTRSYTAFHCHYKSDFFDLPLLVVSKKTNEIDKCERRLQSSADLEQRCLISFGQRKLVNVGVCSKARLLYYVRESFRAKLIIGIKVFVRTLNTSSL